MKDSTYNNSPILAILVVVSVLCVGWPILIPLLCLLAMVLGPTLLLVSIGYDLIHYRRG